MREKVILIHGRFTFIILTTYNFYNKFREKIRVFVFLRNEIFNVLEFQDKNNIKDNMVVNLFKKLDLGDIIGYIVLLESVSKELCLTKSQRNYSVHKV